jgi:SAM-dependent methyltransferase
MSDQEFTGERYVPGQGGCQIAYEHLHRYAFAAPLARGKRVLDIACGSGYGAALLAREADRVTAFDLDPAVVARVKAGAQPSNLDLLAAHAGHLPLRPRVADLVTAFEVIEHVRDPEELVRETARVVRPDGTVLISTPNRAVYSDARDYRNPYHVREFYREEFLQLLRGSFAEVGLLEQQLRAGSMIGRSGAGATNAAVLLTRPLPDNDRPESEPMYFLAVCSPQRNVLSLPEASVYLDLSDGLLRELDERHRATLGEVERVNAELRRMGQWGRQLEGEIHARDEALVKASRRFESENAARDRTIRALQREMRLEVERRDAEIDALQRSLEERLQWVRALEDDVSSRDGRIREAYRLLDDAAARLAKIRHHRLYRILRRLRLLPD